MQGDVTKILAANGSVVVQYSYDSWGKDLSVTGSLASTVGAKNPIRYRGYYYDTETELYYLNSRYYDPETGRFISPDVVAEGGNLYTYCTNDPVNRSDDSGYLSKAWKRRLMKIAAGIVFAVGAVAVTVATGGAALPVIAGIVGGAALSGAIGGTIALIQGNDGKEAIIDGLVDGFMWSGFFSAGSATINAVRSAGTAIKPGVQTISTKKYVAPNDVVGAPRVGSALKTDKYHNFPTLIDNYAGYAKQSLTTHNAVRYELNGYINGAHGIFEWIVNDKGEVIHRLFKLLK